MNEVQLFIKENKIEKEEIEAVVSVLFSSFSIFENSNIEESIENKAFLERLIAIINRFIKSNNFKSKKDRLQLIRITDKLSAQKELLDLQNGILSGTDLQKAGMHLGSKAQSAFSE